MILTCNSINILYTNVYKIIDPNLIVGKQNKS